MSHHSTSRTWKHHLSKGYLYFPLSKSWSSQFCSYHNAQRLSWYASMEVMMIGQPVIVTIWEFSVLREKMCWLKSVSNVSILHLSSCQCNRIVVFPTKFGKLSELVNRWFALLSKYFCFYLSFLQPYRWNGMSFEYQQPAILLLDLMDQLTIYLILDIPRKFLKYCSISPVVNESIQFVQACNFFQFPWDTQQ